MSDVTFHFVPSAVFSNTYHGSYKDVISRVRWFESLPQPYRQIRLERDDPEAALAAMEDTEDPKILIEYSTFPKTLQALRRRFPQAFIAVRSHNIEPLQFRDNHGWWPSRGPLWMLYGMGRLLAGDIACKRYADVIYCISDWEQRVYWNRLPGRARTEWLPYFCPAHLLPTVSIPRADRRRIVCLPTLVRHRKSIDLVTRFVRFAETANQVRPGEYEFVLTGQFDGWGIAPSTAVTYAGVVDDLRGLLSSACAVALLSPLGYGFKTTIADALAHGASVLAHPRLLARSPLILHTALIAVDASDATSVERSLDLLRSAPDALRLQTSLRSIAEEILTSDFGLQPVVNAVPERQHDGGNDNDSGIGTGSEALVPDVRS